MTEEIICDYSEHKSTEKQPPKMHKYTVFWNNTANEPFALEAASYRLFPPEDNNQLIKNHFDLWFFDENDEAVAGFDSDLIAGFTRSYEPIGII